MWERARYSEKERLCAIDPEAEHIMTFGAAETGFNLGQDSVLERVADEQKRIKRIYDRLDRYATLYVCELVMRKSGKNKKAR